MHKIKQTESTEKAKNQNSDPYGHIVPPPPCQIGRIYWNIKVNKQIKKNPREVPKDFLLSST